MARTIEVSAGVSAIIPTWNRRELVQRAIDSALAQTRPPEEIIVVDDGSTDGTGDALRSRYGDLIGERIVYHRQDNAGVSAARNAGMRLARGRYFALLDSDDLWHPEKNARQLAWLDAHPDFGMVLCDVVRVDADGTPFDVFRRREVLPEDGWALRWLRRCSDARCSRPAAVSTPRCAPPRTSISICASRGAGRSAWSRPNWWKRCAATTDCPRNPAPTTTT
jgi:glycosyltransferase involved in cell wall biosynthesis